MRLLIGAHFLFHSPKGKLMKKISTILIIIIIMGLFFTSCDINNTPDYSSGAKSAAMEEIKSKLRDPSSAKWNEVNVTEKDDYQRYIIYLDVTATNGFGGPVRAYYYVCVRMESNSKYYVKPFATYCTASSYNLELLKVLNNWGKDPKALNNNENDNVPDENFNADDDIINGNNNNNTHTHDWGEWTATTPPTCTTAGVETRICSHNASHTETRTVKALNHDWGEWMATTPPTATSDGEETRICSHNASHIETRIVNAIGIPGLDFYLINGGTAYSVAARLLYGSTREASGDIVIPSVYRNLPVAELYSLAFLNCSLTSIIIPASITSIPNQAFNGCGNLTAVTIPANMISIGNDAFYMCNSLATVYYGGADSTAWNNITIGSSNGKLTNATRYYYSETQSAGCWHWVNDVPALW